jgi:hypothetical protein
MLLRQGYAVALLTGFLAGSFACATGPELDLTLHESDRGRIYLERIPDRSFQAAHPIKLPIDTMGQILRGVLVKENRGFVGNLVVGEPKAVRAFGDEDVEFLAPLLVEGLTRAASDQQVGFRVAQTGATAESKTGSLYVYGRSLYLTLPWLIAVSRYGAGGPAPSHTILFIPDSARRPDSYRDARSTDATLVIDYDVLATMPAASEMRPTADQPPTPTPTKGELTQRDADLDGLRRELEDIKKKLAEQEAERTRSAPSSSPKTPPRSTP